jgi:hypothetical protein
MQVMVAVIIAATRARRTQTTMTEDTTMKALVIATILALGMTSAVISVAHADPTWTGTYFDQLSRDAE